MTILEALENLDRRGCSLSDAVESVKFFKDQTQKEYRVKRLLKDLGIPEDMDGFEYLSITIENTMYLAPQKPTLEYFYRNIAQVFGKKQRYVQNQIRHAIQIASKSVYFWKYTNRIGNSQFIQTKVFVDSIIEYYKVLDFLAK